MNQAAFPFVHGRRAERPVQPASPARRPPAGPEEVPKTALSGTSSDAIASSGQAAPTEDADPGDALGFDHARYGVVPPAGCLWPGHPVREGWERGRRLVGRRARPATLAVRRWLALRLAAWSEGRPFDDHQITPQVLRSLESATRCPVTGRALGDDAQVVAVDAARGWVAGNLALMSAEAAALWRTLDWPGARAALACAQAQADAGADGGGEGPAAGLPLRVWRRIVALKSLATPLAHEVAMCIPLVVLPPNRLRLVNPIQELQAVLTLQLAVPGWGQRARALIEAMPLALRCEFNLFFNSLLAQALREGQGPGRSEMRDALALAWEDPVVQRRWGRFARLVDAPLAGTLVDRLAREGLPGLHVVRHEDERLAA